MKKCAWNKGKKIQTNTGRTHFKKGMIPWNKNHKMGPCWRKGKTLEQILGIKQAKITKIRLSLAHKGQVGWLKGIKGIHCSPKTEFKSGKLHPGWKGGKTKHGYTYEFLKYIKFQIQKRDNYKCKICGKKKQVSVHHIDYNKANNKFSNLISLCRRCHGRTLTYRKYWIKICKLFLKLKTVN